MKVLRRTPGAIVFLLHPGEQAVLEDILGLYPAIPPAHARRQLQGGDEKAQADAQRLLDEALAEQRASHRRRLRTWLKFAQTFRTTPGGVELLVPHSDAEWLLQVLNDVRVGNWIALGEPEELPRALPEDKTQAVHACAMELAGWFQMALLGAVRECPEGPG